MQIAGKTFLSGEYAVLEGGSAIGFATKPFFEFSDFEKPEFYQLNIHPESALGLYLKSKKIRPTPLFIKNGYEVGGFGQSTAEFINQWMKIENHLWPLDKKYHLKIYKDYLNLFEQNVSIKPSGADLLTQINKGIVVFKNNQSAEVHSFVWPFTNYKVLIFSTVFKIKTHEHLQSLDRQVCRDLISLSDEVAKNFMGQKVNPFLHSMQEWIQLLKSKGLTHPDVVNLADVFNSKFPNCVFKPCGALGADVIAIIVPVGLEESVINYADSINLKYQTSSSDLSIF